ncbi:MAG: ABC transporter permease [Candidatus Krumholzibacteriota bacterium]|nr:ABC transporter permease [Candidatus Krumholzibacteriota bacterium]
MSETGNIISAEKYKLSRRRSTLLLPAGIIILSAIIFFSVDFATQRDWIGITSGFYLASSSIGWMINIIALLTIIITSFQISGEFAMGTVKAAWVRPASRSSWYAGKLVTVSAASSLLFLIALATITLLAYFKYGFSSLMEKDYLVHSVSSLAARYVMASLLTILSLISLVVVTAFVASLFLRPGSAIAVTVMLAFFMSIISIYQQAGPFLLSNSLTAPFEQMKVMSKGLPVPYRWNTFIWQNITCAMAYLVLFAASGQYVINKKEITF